MPIDAARALSAPPQETTFAWTRDDVLLYHLALGAGVPPTDPIELRYTTEPDLQVLPSFGVVAPTLQRTEPPNLDWPGIDVDLARILHGSQRIEVHAPLPIAAQAVAAERISALHDKGSAAVVVQETTVHATDGTPLWTSVMRMFVRGEGGFGGERGDSVKVSAPERAPDIVLGSPTLPQQALLYRLLGDRNPLHSEPAAANAAGFPRPILHGLCSYGIVLKAIVAALLDGDVSRVRSYDATFRGIVFPGETLRTSVWHDGEKITALTTVEERDSAPALGAELTVAA